jgi:hypothetical protein
MKNLKAYYRGVAEWRHFLDIFGSASLDMVFKPKLITFSSGIKVILTI